MTNPATDKLVAQLSQMLQTASDVTWEQAPLVFKDLLTAGMIQGWLCLLVFPVVLAAFTAIWKMSKGYLLHQDLDGPYWFVALILGAVSFIPFVDGVATLLTITFAPRAYLLGLLR